MTHNNKFKDIILSKLVKPDHKSVGLEIESIIYTKNDKRLPVNSQRELSAVKVLDLMNNSNEKMDIIHWNQVDRLNGQAGLI